LLRPGGQLIFLVNSVLLMLTIADQDGLPATETLLRPYFGMHRFEWPDDNSVEFHLGHGDMIRLLRRCGLQVEDLLELRPLPGASASHPIATVEWARNGPAKKCGRHANCSDALPLAQRLPGQATAAKAGSMPGGEQVADLAAMKRAYEDGLNGQKVQWGSSGGAEIKDLAAVKRDLQRRAVEAARARTGLRGVLGTRPARSPDSGLAGCSSALGADQVAARDYPKIAAQFAGSRWPDLRVSGLAYVEIATKLRSTHAYGGETVWFIERLAAACAQHGEASNRFPI
jgi:hypothetical protein